MRYLLQLQNRKRNVLLIQLREYREEEDKGVTHVPIIREAPSKTLESSTNTPQKTLLLKRGVEVSHVTAELVAKRQEIKARMEAASQRRAELAAKRNKMQQKLERKVAKYQVYEDFLLKTGDKLPDSDCGPCPKITPEHMLAWEHGDPLVRAIIRKHKTLSATNQNLIKNLVILSDDYKKSQHDLEALLWEHDTTKTSLMDIKWVPGGGPSAIQATAIHRCGD
ncbi:uncharacterized protein CCDC197 [Spheniscus humboldti]